MCTLFGFSRLKLKPRLTLRLQMSPTVFKGETRLKPAEPTTKTPKLDAPDVAERAADAEARSGGKMAPRGTMLPARNESCWCSIHLTDREKCETLQQRHRLFSR